MAVNKALKPIDEYLLFIQQSFNTDGAGFSSVVAALNAVAEYLNPIINQNSNETSIRPSHWDVYASREGRQLISTADKLKNNIKTVKILSDPDKYTKFNLLSDEISRNAGALETYSLMDSIIDDIYVARDWLKSYNDYQKRLKKLINKSSIDQRNIYLQKQLLVLGQSILGRAQELTPYKTGTLRRSGVLMVVDGGNSIIVAFTAPYATYVHENLEIQHPYHESNPDCGGQAKFLEKALQEFFPDRQVWTEILGYQGVAVKISINPLYIEYKHYGS